MDRARVIRLVAVTIAVPCLLIGSGCTERRTTTGDGPLPVSATAYPNPLGTPGPVARDAPQDIQELRVEIINGSFDADRYDAQARATRLIVTTRGGRYTLRIDRLLQPRQLALDSTTEIGLTLPETGEYRMELDGGSATAVLNVRPAGGR